MIPTSHPDYSTVTARIPHLCQGDCGRWVWGEPMLRHYGIRGTFFWCRNCREWFDEHERKKQELRHA